MAPDKYAVVLTKPKKRKRLADSQQKTKDLDETPEPKRANGYDEDGKTQKELQSVEGVLTESALKIPSLQNQNTEQQTELKALKAYRSTNDSQLAWMRTTILQATEIQYQIAEKPDPFDITVAISLGIDKNIALGPATLLPHAGDPSMSGDEVWNDVIDQMPQLSNHDPVGGSIFGFTSLLTEAGFRDWAEELRAEDFRAES